jgi:hypothetical protein
MASSLLDDQWQQINDDTFGGYIKFEPRTIPLSLNAFGQVLKMFEITHLRVASRQNRKQ